jgi:riboflavin synthase
MFTGIVEELGRVRSLEDRAGAARLVVQCATVNRDSSVGDSVAVNGVCLTAVEVTGEALSFDLGRETMDRSTLGGLRAGDPVNLERPLTLATRLGGHLVQGHVDGVAAVRSVDRNGAEASIRIALPSSLRPYVVEKGSIAVDGVSLTVTVVDDEGFEVALIPHTLAATTLGERGPGDGVNLEADVVAKYVENLARRGR